MATFLHHLFRALNGYVQRWTKLNIPAECQIEHDYGNGEGAVPSAPVDLSGVRNDIIKILHFPVNKESCGVRNDIISAFKIPFYTEASGVRNDIIATLHYPINHDACGVSNDIIMVEQLQ